ncbi:hypothetical protein D3C72_1840870 [compost metagenome]
MWPVSRVRHLALPQSQQGIFQAFVWQAVGKAAAGAATVKAEDQPRALRSPPVLVRPQVKAAMVTMHPGAPTLGGVAFRAPDQRAVGKQPDRTTLMAGHGVLNRKLKLLARQLLSEVEQRRIGHIQGCSFNCRHSCRQDSS